MIKVEQSLIASAPDGENQIADALQTIRDPEPYLSDEPFEIVFGFTVDNVDVSIDGGQIKASRTLNFQLDFEDAAEAANWLVEEGIAQADDTEDSENVFASIDPERLATTLVGDFEGSTIGDDMIDFESEYSVSYQL